MKIDFEKFSGAKNVFLITDKLNWSQDKIKQLTKKVCDPYEGFSADGVVFVEAKGGKDFKWDFYNSDGSGAEMCGNAARCTHAFIQKRTPTLTEVAIQTGSGIVTSVFKEGLFHVQMTAPLKKMDLNLTSAFFSSKENLEAFSEVASFQSYFADTGVPHLVIPVNNWEKALTLSSIWFFLRKHTYFEKGTNVTLVQSKSDGTVKAITFERGVDGFTQACGTGAVAAALYIGKKENRQLVSISMPGGDLKVDLSKQSPILIGSADLIGQVSIDIKE